MTTETKEVVELITNVGSQAVTDYTAYMIKASVVQLVAVGIGLFMYQRLKKQVHSMESDEAKALYTMLYIAILAGCFFATIDAVKTLCAPRAMAIHQLAEDLGGK